MTVFLIESLSRERSGSDSPSAVPSVTITCLIRLSRRSYYRLFAFLNNQDERTEGLSAEVDVRGLTAEQNRLQKQLKAFFAGRKEQLATWESSLSDAEKRSSGRGVKDSGRGA